MINSEQEIDKVMSQWMVSKRFTPDAKTNASIRQLVEENLEQLGGFVSIASFERAYLELTASGAINPFRGSVAEQPAAAPAIPTEVITLIESPRTTASELRHRYNTDQKFRTQYDAYQQLKGQKQQPGVVSLTAEQYHSLPAQMIVTRYRREPGFKAAVDALIAKGLI